MINGIISAGKRAFRWLFQLVFPRRCVLCRDRLPTGEQAMVCPACSLHIRTAYRNSIPPAIPGADGADAPLLYKGSVAVALKRYKFKRESALCRWFSAHAAVCLSMHRAEWTPEMITYVPLGTMRWWSRGFNQSKAVACYLGRQMGLPVRAVLRKKAWRGKQSKRSAKQRILAAQGLFTALPGHAVSGKRVLLVDDIITTGATAADAVRALREAGAAAVYVLAIARTPSYKETRAASPFEKPGF